jgi:glycerophosphoryl diester phosphodiesterase/HEAT repeat protein
MAALIALFATPLAQAEALLPGGVALLCHRTANEDVPENTLESLEQAALLGCNVIEIDLRRTLDGKIVLNHDGMLDRLTDGSGEVETSYYADLELRDAGSWMGDRFSGMRMVLFEDALRLARDQDVRLILDMKDKGMGADVLQILEREGMLHRVQFNGEWADVKKLYPGATDVGDGTVWVEPGVTPDQVREYHRQGTAVVANFSANAHEMDLMGMKAAVGAGVDGINVDYPRLGADAVGRPVERKLDRLILKANSGESDARAAAILELSRFTGFPLEGVFLRSLLDADDHVSHAAALALVTERPKPTLSAFAEALQSGNADARANAAWALGMLGAPAGSLLPLLQDKDPQVLQSALLALGRVPEDVGSKTLLPFLSDNNSAVRGAAAVALARHAPEVALRAVPAQLEQEISSEQAIFKSHERRGESTFTQPEINQILAYYRSEMEMLRAISMLRGNDVTEQLLAQALHPDPQFLQPGDTVAGFQLWDRIGLDPAPALQALGSTDGQVADRAEWMLVKAGAAVLPQVRKALESQSSSIRERAIRIVAWQGDANSLDQLHTIQAKHGPDADLASWAITKIDSLHPKM